MPTPPLRRSPQPGRNDRCPCGSGKKFKKCHGGGPLTRGAAVRLPDAAALAFMRAEAQERRRVSQQGLGREIVSAEVQGTRVVAIGGRLAASPEFRTFHDFLFAYVQDAFGGAWATAQSALPEPSQHPLLRWRAHLRKHQQRQPPRPAGEVTVAPQTAASTLYLQLAYDLYTLEHNNTVRTELLRRLRDPQQFSGARYEASVAASLLRGGFTIDFENEVDRRSTHCEFTATHRDTGLRYSVEAKHREPRADLGSCSGRDLVGNRLRKALRKAANHPRVIFLDVELTNGAASTELPPELHRIAGYLRRYEMQQPNAAAYIFLTPSIDERDLDSTNLVRAGVQESVGISELRHGASFRTVREAVAARDRHRPMYDLLDAVRRFSDPPATFDGDLPEFAYEETGARLLVGHRCMVPDQQGRTVPGTLVSAIVVEGDGTAVGTYRLANGRVIVASCPLTDAELRAYRRDPETFFGVPQSVTMSIDPTDAVAAYDFLHQAYARASKDDILKLLREAPDLDQLRELDQPALLAIACERFAEQILRSAQRHRAT